MNKNFVIIISGPTATGKSNLAINLGDDLPIEIVNADIGSFYTQLTIGTAKPDWKNQEIPHHFFDVIDSPINWTAPQFREKLEVLIKKIWARCNIPVIVGGSAFYIQSFFYKNHTLELPKAELIDSLEEQSAEDLWEQLNKIDPKRAEKIGPCDHYRLVRALAIWQTQGQKPSDFQPTFDPLAPFYFVSLTRDRDELYNMIDQRVLAMMEAGWLDEVRSLIDDPEWVEFLCKKKMIGYDQLAQYLLGYACDQSLDEVVGVIQQRTRNYAKRQITFLNKLVSSVKKDQAGHQNTEIQSSGVECFNLTESDSGDLIHRIKK